MLNVAVVEAEWSLWVGGANLERGVTAAVPDRGSAAPRMRPADGARGRTEGRDARPQRSGQPTL